MLKQLNLILLFTMLIPFQAGAELIDRIAAKVNDQVITLSELNEELAPTFEKIKREAPPDQIRPAMRQATKDTLSALIDRMLINQKAKQSGLSVSKEDLDAAIDRILAENKISYKKFRQQLKAMGMTETLYREKMKGQILQSKLINYEIRSKVVITDEKVRRHYQESFGRQVTSDGYHLLQIGCAWGGKGRSETKLDAKKRADQLRAMILEGESFKEIARAYSDLPSGADGGDIGVFKEKELAPYMSAAISGLKPGAISQTIETSSGFQFFKILASREGNVIQQAPLESVKEEIRSLLHEQELRKNFDKWVKQLRDDAYIDELL